MGRTAMVETNHTVLSSIQKNMAGLFAAEAKVASYIATNPSETVQVSITELAERSDVSDATVVRLCKRLGFSGFYQMKLQLSHDLGVQKQARQQRGAAFGTLQEYFVQMEEQVRELSRKTAEKTVKQCADAINQCDTVYVIGAGHSRILAEDLVFRLAGCGVRTSGGDHIKIDLGNLLLGSRGDVLVCISKSGESRRVKQAMEVAKKLGMTTIAVTATEKNPLAAAATYSLHCGKSPGRVGESNLWLMALLDAVLLYVKNKLEDPEYFEELIAESRL